MSQRFEWASRLVDAVCRDRDCHGESDPRHAERIQRILQFADGDAKTSMYDRNGKSWDTDAARDL